MNKLILSVAFSLTMVTGAYAGPVSEVPQESWSTFQKGANEFEILAGAFWGVGNEGTPKRPDTGLGLGSLRYGWMLTDPVGDGIFRGNFEFLTGLFGGGVFEGPGSYLVGADLVLRYNFVQPQAQVVPFFQISAGGVYSDIASDDPVQGLLGSDWNFALGSSIGVRWMLSKRLALTTAFEYRHFSNAGATDRNRGYNALGGLVGLAWFY
jgi:lipid A 3-O-deacylase